MQFIENDPAADRQAQDDLESAARAVGFRNIAFQYEPIAAALDYELSTPKEELVFVVDIGGGTADFSIVRVSPEKSRATPTGLPISWPIAACGWAAPISIGC